VGRHSFKRTGELLAADPAAPWPLRLWRWWWVFPPLGLALWPISPVAAIVLTVSTLGVGVNLRVLAPILLRPRHGLLIVPRGEADAWHEAGGSIVRIRAAWPALGAMADPVRIGPALDQARWGVAVLLFRRAAVTRALKELDEAVRGLAEQAPLRAEVADRRAELAGRHAELDGQVAERLQALRRLAEVTGAHAQERRRVERVRSALRRVRQADEGGGERPDVVAEVTERTAAVLTAYRELSALPRPDA
jgi:hypothetical protein